MLFSAMAIHSHAQARTDHTHTDRVASRERASGRAGEREQWANEQKAVQEQKNDREREKRIKKEEAAELSLLFGRPMCSNAQTDVNVQ